MPTLEQNRTAWDRSYKWPNRGDEWSKAWGNPSMQWHGTLMPRIQQFLPAGRVLEIACGYGRWTQFLAEACDQLVAVDLSKQCIKACGERFAGNDKIELHLNDGRSLDFVADDSVDFIFSFDSLVHADRSVLEGYIEQFPRILRDGGAAFIHHSNLARYMPTYTQIRRVRGLEKLLKKLRVLEPSLHWRDPSVAAETVHELSSRHGLHCLAQETVNWGTRSIQIDCFSTLLKGEGRSDQTHRVFRNARFMREVYQLQRLSALYTGRV